MNTPTPSAPPDYSTYTLAALRCALRETDPNGWETLEDNEQTDPEILRAALAYLWEVR